MIIENIKMAFRNFVTNKLRTFLSLLGIIIGVSSVILITTLGNSATADIQNEISGAGMDLVMVYGGWGGARSQQLFTAGLGRTLEEKLPSIVSSTPCWRNRSRPRAPGRRINTASPASPPPMPRCSASPPRRGGSSPKRTRCGAIPGWF